MEALVALMIVGFIIVKPATVVYAVAMYMFGMWAFGMMGDAFMDAAMVRRKAYGGSEDEDHTEKSVEMYRKVGAFASMFVPFLPIVAIVVAGVVFKKTGRAKAVLSL